MIYFLVKQDRMGHLTISRGKLSMYVQQDQEIEEFLSQLSKRSRNRIEKGWTARVLLSDEYLTVMEDEETYRMTDAQLMAWKDKMDELNDRIVSIVIH
jgi:hypothetical protein